MALISESIKDVVSINLKHRDDDFADQFTRIFICKMLIMSSLVTSLDFFNDRMSCVRPTDSKAEEDYVQSVCWIQGFYVYKDTFGSIGEYYAYGMPRKTNKDGLTAKNHLCAMKTDDDRTNTDCDPMERMYFSQYQYMPFYIAALAVLYYLPYVLFRAVNSDVIALHKDVTAAIDADRDTSKLAVHVTNTYFKYSRNGGVMTLRFRVFANTCVKAIYVIVNCAGFMFTNKILNYRYTNYGLEWVRWSQYNNTDAYHFQRKGNVDLTPKPGDYILPSMGFCDVVESYTDKKDTHLNHYKTICEISQNVLYQYIFLVLWFVLVAGILISLSGFTKSIVDVICMHARSLVSNKKKTITMFNGCEHMTLRELQYMMVIRRKNDLMYTEVLNMIRSGTHV